ncbi:MAG: extracellular solute-binding protein [Firmicutes bacterium]|nr:extracellular solute-binding protein [Bacillota bacterium]
MKKRSLLLLVTCLVLVIGVSSICPAMAAKKVKLTLWGGYPEMAPFYKQVIADYQKENPNVEISFLTHPLREHEQKLSAAIPSNTAADMIETTSYTMRKFVEAGLLNPNPDNIDAFLKSGAFDDFFINDLTIGGATYGLPLFQGRQVIFWNKAMFREAGLPGAPTTWEEVIEYAQKVAKYDENGELVRAGISLRKSGGGSGVAEKWWFWLYPAGGSIVEEVAPGKWRNGYNNEAGQDALKLYIDLLHKYKVDSHRVKADSDGFALQTHAMFTRESWVVGHMQQYAPDVEYDTAPLPVHKRAGTICNLVNMYVTKSCKNPDVAWDFLQFMFKPEYQKLLLSEVGWFPCLNADYEEIFQRVPQYRAFMELPAGFELYGIPPLACFDEIQTKLAERLVQAFMDETLVDNPDGIAKVLADAAKETDDILRENGVYAD